MKMSREELSKRFADADRMVLILRRATLDMQVLRAHVFAERRREAERSSRDRDVEDAASVLRRSGDLLDIALIDREVDQLEAEIPDFDVRANWTAIRSRGGR